MRPSAHRSPTACRSQASICSAAVCNDDWLPLPQEVEQRFVETMDGFPVATHTEDANRQHYEVPAGFFAQTLGPQRKYSCCLYPTTETTLAEAETLALVETVKHAGIEDGMSILELGCGWGSLSLHIAQHFPNARIISVSNSASQRAYILGVAEARELANLTVITADMNDFSTDVRYDRVVSVEMFEHMSNWRALLQRISGWMKPGARLFPACLHSQESILSILTAPTPPTGSRSTSSPVV